MTEILLTETIPSDSKLERLNLFAGRHMGEDEFDRQQAYADRRIAPLLAGFQPGIVQGLEVRASDIAQKGDGFTVNAGLAVAGNGTTLGLYYPLRETWQTLIQNYLQEAKATAAGGIFYLTLTRTSRYVDADPSIHPEQRTEFDPTRDARQLVVGSLSLKRIAMKPSAATATRELVENWVAANHVELEFLQAWSNAIPLGLAAIENKETDITKPANYQINWFSNVVGRYMAVRNGGYQALLNQTTTAFRRIRAAAANQSALSVKDYIAANLKLDFLPAAGELPFELITNLASHKIAPKIAWLPKHIAVDIVPVPEESVAALIQHHLPRRVVDLRIPAGERLRLLLAVNEPDYKPTLLDIPQVDGQMISDLFRYFARAYDQWVTWTRQYQYLYRLVTGNPLDQVNLKSLDLPEPIAPPQLPQVFFNQVIRESFSELGREPDSSPFYPYSLGVPPFPAFYQQWGTGNPVLPKPIVYTPQELATDGVVVQYAVANSQLQSLDDQIRDARSRVEKFRDYISLQRQQLDNQTVSLSALAGGVAGDGSGLQVARWLPFTSMVSSKLDLAAISATLTPPVAPTQPQAIKELSGGLFNQVSANLMNYKANSSISSSTQQLLAASNNKAVNTSSIFTSILRKAPTTFSSLQFNLNNQRLDKIAEAPKQALTKPAFDTKEFRFGVLEHIRAETQEYKKAFKGLMDLLTTLVGVFGPTEGNALRAKLEAFGTCKTSEQLTQDLFNEVLAQYVKEGLALPAATEKANQYMRDNPGLSGPRIYEALFNVGKILTHQIAYMESLYGREESKLEGLLRSRINKENEIEKLIALIRAGTEQLAAIDKRRIEYLGDYGVAQRLVDDDWLQTYKLDQERTRVLTKAVRGLYYVRVVQAPVGLPFADPLLLRYGKADDLVPGWRTEEDPDLPDDIDDFFDTLMEAPLNDWVNLRGLKVHLPAPDRLDYMSSLRNLRLQNKTLKQSSATAQNAGRSQVSLSLYNVRVQTQSTLKIFAQINMSVTQVSSKLRQEEAAKVVSVADLLSGTRGVLQKQAQTLHNRLEQAVAGVLAKLNELAPSLRFEWAQLAEDDYLAVDRVELWPGLDRAEREDFNATRTLAELIAWMYRQLDANASAAGRSAMRNLIRACLIHASLGDPAEILYGQVQVPPRRLSLGEPLRIQLNRAPKVGTVLHLLDAQQQVVAMLNVDDHDDQGTVAKITHVTQKDSLVTTQYRVVASKATRQLLQ